MADMIRRDTAIDELERIRYKLWEIDIPSPTVPEYIEHHEQVQSVMKAVTESVDRIWKEPAQPEIIRCKDCKHWIPYDWMFSEVWQSKNIADYPEDEIGCDCSEMAMKANDFCSRAERRTE